MTKNSKNSRLFCGSKHRLGYPYIIFTFINYIQLKSNRCNTFYSEQLAVIS